MSRAVFGAAAVLWFTAWAAAQQTQPAPDPQRIQQDIAGLSAPSAEARQVAEDHLLNSPPQQYELIAAAAAKLPAASPAAQTLQSLLKALRVWTPGRARRDAREAAEYAWNLDTALAAYEKFGLHNPSWDALAREGIHLYIAQHRDENRTYNVLEHITSDLHCDDPLILYYDARMLSMHQPPNIQQIFPTYMESCDQYLKSQYPPYRQCAALARAVPIVNNTNIEQAMPLVRKILQRDAATALLLWPQAVVEPKAPPEMMFDLAFAVVDAQLHFGADRGRIVEQMLPPFQQAFPKSPLPLAFKGISYTSYAWDARGNGFAKTVTEQNWKLYHERLAVAEQALQQAYDMDPADPNAATAMLMVELGQHHGVETATKWFGRAVAADPGNFSSDAPMSNAYNTMLQYLLPRWYGSEEAVLGFARLCAKTRNTYDNVTWTLVQAHDLLAVTSANPVAYWRQPQVWADIEPVARQRVMDDAADVRARSVYACYAAKCEQWKIADEQFKTLGEHAVESVFGGKEKLAALQARAAQEKGQ